MKKMKFSFDFPRVITFIKKNPEKVISWSLLATFIFLSLYLAIGWSKRTTPLSPEKIAIGGISRKAVAEAVIPVDFGGLLVRKPITYYNDFVQRNPFARLPGIVGPRPNGGNDKEPPPPPGPGTGLICRGIMHTPEGPVAFIEGREKTYVVREGDEVEGWRIIKIDKEKVKLYNERERKELILPLGGGPEEKERARKRAEERRRKMREESIEEPGRFEGEFLPGLLPPGMDR